MRTLIIDGRIGKDAEMKTTANGTKYVTFPVANNYFVDGQEKTDWFDIICYDAQALEKRLPVLSKGTFVQITGTPVVKTNVDKTGKVWVNMTLKTAAQFINIPSFKSAASGQTETTATHTAAHAQQAPAQHSADQPIAMPNFTQTASVAPDVNDDELPF